MTAARILVVDDDADLLALIGMRLTAAGYDVALAASGAEALETFRAERPRAVVTDLRMDGMDGHALFERLHAEAPSVPVIILTAHGTIPDAVAATQRGVFSFLTKPFDGRELLARIAEAVALSPPIAADTGAETNWRANFVSVSPIMDELLRQARRAAESDDPLLISGPRGSGKEALARVVHGAGSRAPKPFVVMRCGPQAGDASEDAAFGDALDAARGGTLFLDDVGELAANVQTRLLPLVREVSMFSANSAKARTIRVIAATAQALDNAIRAGQFRADLFYGLNQTALTLPALAERRDDIPLLVSHFARRWAERNRVASGASHGFAPDALGLLQEAQWPGNVRQLRNVVEQALGQTVTPLVPASVVRRVLRDDNEREMAAFDDARRAFEYDYLVDLLTNTAGNVAQAARIAQRNRTEFYKLLARHALDPATFKPVAK